jgi:hypothetical protein
MGNTRHDITKSAVLALSLGLGGGWTVDAQMTGGPGLSSGTGAGTGAGGFSGVLRNRSGSISGVGPGSLSGESGGVGPLRLGPRRGFVPFGPGVDVSFPNDPYLLPFLMPEESGNAPESKGPTGVTSDLLASARLIADPAERSLALRQIANGAIASNQLFLAHRTLEEAITAASQVTVPLVHDQRLIGLVTSTNLLTTELLRVARENRPVLEPEPEPEPKAEAVGVDPSQRRPEATVLIRLARLEWRRGVYLASVIGNPTYRNEMLYRVAESESMGSASIANMAVPEAESLGNRPGTVAAPLPGPTPSRPPTPDLPRGGRPVRVPSPAVVPPAPLPSQAPPAPGSRSGDRRPQDAEVYDKLADEILVDAWDAAKKIDRLIWRYRGMVRIALSASDSHQYTRGVELARTIENAESRAEALILLAEAQCRNAASRGTHDQDAAATAAYQAAAEAVASIPQDGLRGVIAGILVDSLIAVGRFDDARACTVIHPDEAERFVELGAIAESQGRRGAADAARRWIATEAPAGYRSALYRRVVAGVLWSVEQNRSRDLTGGEIPPPQAR